MKKTWFFLATITFLSIVWIVFNFALFVFSNKSRINPLELTGKFKPGETKAIFNNQEITAPRFAYDDSADSKKSVLGVSNNSKRIEIDLTNQRLYAYEGSNLIYNFLISSGKWGQTPVGNFRIWIKLRYTKMEGGSQALNTYYYLPNVPFVMFFYNSQIPKWRGYGIHGTYWHDNFGHPMSHGCINMKTEEVALLYGWAMPDTQGKSMVYASNDNPGTEIVIYGKASDY